MEGKRRGEELVLFSYACCMKWGGWGGASLSGGVCVPLSLLKSVSPLGDSRMLFTLHLSTDCILCGNEELSVECQHYWNDNDRAVAWGTQPIKCNGAICIMV